MSIISKEQFVKILNDYRDAWDTVSAIDRQISDTPILKNTSDFFSAFSLMNASCSTVIELLTAMFDDKNEWISYWMFEQDFGRSWDVGTALDANDNPILLKTAGDLYDFLILEDEKIGGTD